MRGKDKDGDRPKRPFRRGDAAQKSGFGGGRGRPPRREGDDARPRFKREGDDARPRFKRDGDDARPRFKRDGDDARPRFKRDGDDSRPHFKRDGDDARPRFKREGGDERPRFGRGAEARQERPRFKRDGDDARPRFKRDGDEARPRFKLVGDDARPIFKRDGDDARPRFKREGDERPRFKRDGDDARPRFKREGGDERPRFARGAEARQDRPRFKRDGDDARPRFKREGGDDARPRFKRDGDDARPRFKRDGDDARPRFKRDGDDARPRFKRDSDDARPRFKRGGDDARPRFKREGDDARPRFKRDGDDARPRFKRDGDDARPRFKREGGDARPRFKREGGDERPRFGRGAEARQDRPRFKREDDSRPRFKRDGDDARPRFKRDDDSRPRFKREGDDARPRFKRDGDDARPRFKRRDEAAEVPPSAPREKLPGERIAKVVARAGMSSRREAEAMIADGRIAVNGRVVLSPALNVTPRDAITVDGEALPERERTRLFLFHKPRGCVTTSSDPEERQTIYDVMPKDLPRLVSVGRLDFNTEGLLLLTNDGGLARVLELPATGWLRRYRVRAHGEVTQAQLDALREGVTVDGVSYGPIEAELDREQGANVWLTFAIREGKNREVRNVLAHLGLEVNRLIRLSFGPFQLAELAEGAVEEVKPRVLREQLGEKLVEQSGADFDSPLRPVEPAAPKRVGTVKDRKGKRILVERRGGEDKPDGDGPGWQPPRHRYHGKRRSE